jgi:type III restriction enzyme
LSVKGEVDFESLKGAFSELKDFEREFPNVCFSLATGVGKTRLMGAMVTYLFLAGRVRNFLILAPSSTILDKLVQDFSDPTHSKYVFNGISEFAVKRPKIITADNFEQGLGVRNERAKQGDFFANDQEVHINIFNIAKMHTDQRKIKQVSDYLDESYFDYLASLEDLVVLMDEAHRYRASAAMKTIQELKPLLGLEFTATPQLEKGKVSVRFKNILYDYPLSRALHDGYLKEPAVAGRENFDPANYASEEELDRLKVEDGVRLHEQTKLNLLIYSEERGEKLVKPLMLVVAQNTQHADQLKEMMEGDGFFEGNYRGKVMVVHSEVKAEAEELMIRNLLEVESSDNLIEIVIHVNMLREGWDIVNLFTMVPLRKANSKTLIEQNLGRGLRLPFGRRTGVAEIDRHTVVSHDRFNEIIDAANREDSVIRKGIMIGSHVPLEPLDILEVPSKVQEEVNALTDVDHRRVLSKALEAIHCLGIDKRDAILEYVKDNVPVGAISDLDSIVNVFVDTHLKSVLGIPRISVQPRVIRKGRFSPFELDLKHLTVRPYGEGIVVQDLKSGERRVYKAGPIACDESSALNQLMMHLLDFDEVAENEENIAVVQCCSEQMIQHLQSYLKEEDVAQVISQQGLNLAQTIYSQMRDHFEEPVIEWEKEVTEKLLSLKTMHLPQLRGSNFKHFSDPVDHKLNIRQMVFKGFEKSMYSHAKFDSDSERIFSVILENDPSVKRWLKPTRGTFSGIYYSNVACYEPDFIVETDHQMYLCEVKRGSDMESSEVVAKAEAALMWCELATDAAKKNQRKPWTYLLMPHDKLDLLNTLEGLVARFTYSKSNKE